MTVLLPRTLDEALDALASRPGAQPLAGGTDLMVEINYGHRRPEHVVALAGVDALRGVERRDGVWVIGAGTTYTDLQHGPVAARLPALAAAARTVGSPQIRNAGTIGGNVATASPAGDTLPVLVALDARVELRSAERGIRLLAWHEFFTGPKRTARAADELVVALHIDDVDSRQDYLKVGTRNAMVIAVASVAAVVDLTAHQVRVGLGSVGPVPLRAPAAEAWVAAQIDWSDAQPAVADPRTYETFGAMVAEAASPIDDHRSTAAYRRHAVGVMARRALMRLIP